jgi:hypothetical protein
LNVINVNMIWNFIPVEGSTGRILVGLKSHSFELIRWETSQYCATAIVNNRVDNFVWRIIVVYGSPYDSDKLEFLEDLSSVLGKWQGPTLVGGTLTW